MKQGYKFIFPESFWFVADEIGNARDITNADNIKNNPRYDRGEKAKRVDILGVLGELIAIEYLIQKKQDFQFTKLLDYKPTKTADVIVNNKRIDVKTNELTEYSHLLVNEEAHKKGLGKIDLYWFVYIIDRTTAEFYFVNYDDVGTWDCKLMKYTNAYYINRGNIK